MRESSLHIGSEEQSCVVEGHDCLLFSTDVGELIIDYPEVEIQEGSCKTNNSFSPADGLGSDERGTWGEMGEKKE